MTLSAALDVERSPLLWGAAAAAAGGAAGAVLASRPSPSALGNALGWLLAASIVFAIVWRLESGVWILLAVTPLNDYGRIVTWPVGLTLFQVALAASLAVWAWGLYARRIRPLRMTPLRWALALPFLAALWSLPLSLDPSRTAVGAGRLLALWAFALFLSYHAEDPQRRRRMLTAFVVIGVALASLGALQYAFPGIAVGNIHTQGMTGSDRILVRPAGFFLDTNFFAGYLSVACLIASGRLVRSSSLRQTACWSLAALATGVVTLLTLSRSGLAGILVGIVLVVALAPPHRRGALVALVLVLALVAAPFVPSSVVDRVANLDNVMSEGSLATRFLMIGSTVEIIRDHWGTGTGLAAFDVAYPEYRRIGALPRILRPHQVPLAMWAEMGVPGLIAEVVLFGTLVGAFARSRVRPRPEGYAVVLVGIAALLVQAWFQYYLYFEYLWFLAALAAALPLSAMKGTADA